jgi:hypothetical protein
MAIVCSHINKIRSGSRCGKISALPVIRCRFLPTINLSMLFFS